MSSVRMIDIRKSVTMNEISLTAMMMIKMSAVIKSHRSTLGNTVALLIASL
jgi:hypothetical protein